VAYGKIWRPEPSHSKSTSYVQIMQMIFINILLDG